jgi:hypothetical protein
MILTHPQKVVGALFYLLYVLFNLLIMAQLLDLLCNLPPLLNGADFEPQPRCAQFSISTAITTPALIIKLLTFKHTMQSQPSLQISSTSLPFSHTSKYWLQDFGVKYKQYGGVHVDMEPGVG